MKHKGFTLIELLVVVAIIGVLATFVLSSLDVARNKSKDVRMLKKAKELQVAVELFQLDHGRYPRPGTNGSVYGFPIASNCETGQPSLNQNWIDMVSGEMSNYLPDSYLEITGEPWCLDYGINSYHRDCTSLTTNIPYLILFGLRDTEFSSLHPTNFNNHTSHCLFPL